VSKLLIVQVALAAGRGWLAALFVALLLLVFAGMGTTTFAALQGRPTAYARQSAYRDRARGYLPPLLLVALVLLLGLHLPASLRGLLTEAAAALGGGR